MFRQSKYRNKKVIIDGETFDSKKEYKYYKQLCEREKNGEISELCRQVTFDIIPSLYENVEKQLKTKIKIVRKFIQYGITYTADFTYKENGNLVVCDCKASAEFQDPVYRIKKKLMRYLLNIDIIELY